MTDSIRHQSTRSTAIATTRSIEMEQNQPQSEAVATLNLEQLEDRLEMESVGTLFAAQGDPVGTTPVCIRHF
jgi:hypothetical protein